MDMLLRFAVSNFGPLRDRQEVNLVGRRALKDDGRRAGKGLLEVEGVPGPGVLSAVAIFGANASGKTRLLMALDAMARAVQNSHRLWPPQGRIPTDVRQVFRLDRSMAREPTSFEVDAMIGGIRHTYGFSVDDEAVLHEFLHSYPSSRRRVVFERVAGRPMAFPRASSHCRSAARHVRPNSLLVSAGAQDNVPDLSEVHDWFSRVRFARKDNEFGRLHYFTRRSVERPLPEKLRSLIRDADLGISNVEVKDVPLAEEAVLVLKGLLAASGREEDAPSLPETMHAPVFVHTAADGTEVRLAMDDESDGTLALLSLTYPVLDALNEGGVLLVDELDRSLHPLLVERLLDLFLRTGRKHGQVIFTTHNAGTLAQLRRDAIWFTDKRSDGATTVYPATDFHPRKNQQMQRAYLEGRFGAVPMVGSLVSEDGSDG